MPDYVTYTDTPPAGYTTIHTIGKRPSARLLHDEKITKNRLDAINPILWRQLAAISTGNKVNHLGRGHSRLHETA